MRIRPQTISFGRNGARLAPIQIRNVYPRGVTGFGTFKQQPFGVSEELPARRNHGAGRKCLLPSHPISGKNGLGRFMVRRTTIRKRMRAKLREVKQLSLIHI